MSDPYSALRDDYERTHDKLHAVEERLDALRDSHRALVEAPWLVWSNEHEAWWRPNSSGYTVHVDNAGRYTHEEAMKIQTEASYRGNCTAGVPPEIAVLSQAGHDALTTARTLEADDD